MPGLNLDVLCLVSSFITDVPDVLAFSLTCSTLRAPAVYRRLSMHPVTITDETSIKRLHDFIFVDKAARGPHIRAITIPREAAQLLQGVPEDLLRRLLAILSSATRVHTISLYLPSRSSSSLLASPLIVPAIARLTGIRELTLVSSFERANALLRCIRSPIETFRYRSLYDESSTLRNANLIGSSMRLSAVRRRMAMRQEMDEEGLTLEDAASHLSRTLCYLELQHLCLPRRAFQQVQPGPFLAVRSLVLRDITEIVRLDVLLHILPNLDGMLVAEASSLFYRKCVRDRGHVEVVREANQLAQERHAWKKLDRVVATPLMLYTLGLTGPIDHLILDLSPGGGSLLERADELAQHARWAVLRDHTPTHLTIRGLRLPAGLVHLDDLFPADWALAPRTTHVVVDAEYNSVDDDGKLLWPDDVLETLLSRIERPGLTHVRIVTSGLINDADAFSASVHHGIRDLSLERLAIATQFQHAVPSLTHIFLTSRGVVLQNDNKLQEVWSVSKAWRVPSEESFGRHIEEMSFNDAEAVLNMEDMQTTGGAGSATY